VIDHVSLGTHRYAQAVAFYSQVLGPLDMALLRDTGAEASFGTAGLWSFFLYPAGADEPVTGKGMHLAPTCSRPACGRTSAPRTSARCSWTWMATASR
jgi:catechol 2,3-dioxygenase-like lactoylglutathione lyase family enzyme